MRSFETLEVLTQDRLVIAVGAKRFHCAEVKFQPSGLRSPRRNIVTVGAKRFRCAEVLFKTGVYLSPRQLDEE